MSKHIIGAAPKENQQRLAAEVLELGQSLFETTLEAGNYRSAEDREGEGDATEEIRATAQEFFTALRLLLGIEE